MILTLPWPPKELSPNTRKHWAVKAKYTKQYRAVCAALAARVAKPERLTFQITFHAPDARPRDDDNMIGSFKSGRDGLADAWGVNDRAFQFMYKFGPPVKGGQIIVEAV